MRNRYTEKVRKNFFGSIYFISQVKKCILILFSLLSVKSVYSQNLVSNPSFEKYFIIPDNFTTVKVKNQEVLPNWVFIATPDFFHKNAKTKVVGVPKNFAGSMKPHDGNGYAGLILRADPEYYVFSPKYSEFLQNELSEPLKKGKMYCMTLYISLAAKSGFAVDGFGLYFSNDRIVIKQKGDELIYKPHIENKTGNIMYVQNKWMQFSGIYKARGGEKYVTIGDFKSLEETQLMRIKSKLVEKIDFFSYYYIDNLSLVQIRKPSECECNSVSYTLNGEYDFAKQDSIIEAAMNYRFIEDDIFGTVEIGKPFVLRNIYFEFDEYDLLPESYIELDYLYKFFKTNDEYRFEISGHTDSLGSAEYNKVLSENRAKSVVDYLILKGIDKSRITYVGYGSEFPVSTNSTDEGRQENRRVEFIIFKD